jgi:hypothetical protein
MGWLAEETGFHLLRGPESILFSKTPRPVLGPTQLPIQWVPWTLSAVVKQLGREADHSPSPAPRLRMSAAVPIHPYGLWRIRNVFTFTHQFTKLIFYTTMFIVLRPRTRW